MKIRIPPPPFWLLFALALGLLIVMAQKSPGAASNEDDTVEVPADDVIAYMAFQMVILSKCGGSFTPEQKEMMEKLEEMGLTNEVIRLFNRLKHEVETNSIDLCEKKK